MMSSSQQIRVADDDAVSLETYAKKAPLTGDRKLNLDLDKELPKPFLARALVAVDKYHPEGTKGKDPRDMSVLQQHVAFFDSNNDGIVYPWETYKGFRAIGCGVLVSLAASVLINLTLSYPTRPTWIPSLLLPIHINNIHKCKHGSDSETYDTEGRFEPTKFEDIFSKYARTHSDALSWEDISKMRRANKNLYDISGQLTNYMEWKILYSVAKDENGLLHREDVRGVFDGSLFERLANKRASASRNN